MRATWWNDLKTDERVMEIRISSDDLESLYLDKFDRHLIEECEKSDSLADKLLALETIARRKEQENENINKEQSCKK